jgi:WD40 repeat protein
MKLKRVFLTLLFISITLLYAQSNAILMLDTQGHTSSINNILVTKSGDIVSSSYDKTIRVWDSRTGKEKRKILGQIGLGNEGFIYTIALSPNEKFLAVGGLLGNNIVDGSVIRIYDYQKGTILRLLKSHTNVVNDLSFSQDGKFLISGSGDNTAKIWETKNFKLVDTIKTHTEKIYAVRIIKKRDVYYAITVGFDNKISLYNMTTKEVVASDIKSYKLHSLAVSNEHIAVCGFSNEISIYDYSLKLIQTIHSETEPSGLAYSPNKKFLIVGITTIPRNVNIYSANENYKKIQSFQKHTNSLRAVAFLDNQTAISGGGDNNEIYIWDRASAKILQKIVSVGDSIWSLGIKGESIVWGNEARDIHDNSSWNVQKSINLKTFQITTPLSTANAQFKRVSSTHGRYSLSHSKGGDYGYSDAILNIKKDGKIIASITRNGANGLSHRAYGWYGDYIISAGSGGFLKIYNLKGQEIANLSGHKGEIWSIALDGDRLVSGSEDQTIKIWDLSKLKSEMYPQLTLFVSKDNEWVVWTPHGYYNASKKGANYIGFHINHGAEHEAEFLTVGEVKRLLYRPDIVAKALRGEDITKEENKITTQRLLSDEVRTEKLPLEEEIDESRRDAFETIFGRIFFTMLALLTVSILWKSFEINQSNSEAKGKRLLFLFLRFLLYILLLLLLSKAITELLIDAKFEDMLGLVIISTIFYFIHKQNNKYIMPKKEEQEEIKKWSFPQVKKRRGFEACRNCSASEITKENGIYICAYCGTAVREV